MRNSFILYSYYYVCSDEVSITESLEDHSARVIKHIGRLKASPISRYASIKGGVSEDLFIDALLIAGALHDVGKAFYQLNVREDRRGCKYISFVGHEWISTYFIQQLWKHLEPDAIAVEGLMDVTLYAILLHHHAMNVRERGRSSVRYLKPPSRDAIIGGLSRLASLIHIKPVREAYLAILPKTVDNVLRFAKAGLAGLINEVFVIYRRILKEHLGIKGRRVLYLLGVACLVTADYLAAGEVRGSSASRFWGVVEEFSRTYFGGG